MLENSAGRGSDNVSERVKVMEREESDFNQTHIYDRQFIGGPGNEIVDTKMMIS